MKKIRIEYFVCLIIWSEFKLLKYSDSVTRIYCCLDLLYIFIILNKCSWWVNPGTLLIFFNSNRLSWRCGQLWHNDPVLLLLLSTGKLYIKNFWYWTKVRNQNSNPIHSILPLHFGLQRNCWRLKLCKETFLFLQSYADIMVMIFCYNLKKLF